MGRPRSTEQALTRQSQLFDRSFAVNQSRQSGAVDAKSSSDPTSEAVLLNLTGVIKLDTLDGMKANEVTQPARMATGTILFLVTSLLSCAVVHGHV